MPAGPGRPPHRAGREVWNTYGPTEATVVACARPDDGNGAGADRAPPGRAGTWRWWTSEGEPVEEGDVGELVIGGVGLARYLDPARDAEKYAAAPTPGLGPGLPQRGPRPARGRGAGVRRPRRRPGQARRPADRARRGRRRAAGPARCGRRRRRGPHRHVGAPGPRRLRRPRRGDRAGPGGVPLAPAGPAAGRAGPDASPWSTRCPPAARARSTGTPCRGRWSGPRKRRGAAPSCPARRGGWPSSGPAPSGSRSPARTTTSSTTAAAASRPRSWCRCCGSGIPGSPSPTSTTTRASATWPRSSTSSPRPWRRSARTCARRPLRAQAVQGLLPAAPRRPGRLALAGLARRPGQPGGGDRAGALGGRRCPGGGCWPAGCCSSPHWAGWGRRSLVARLLLRGLRPGRYPRGGGVHLRLWFTEALRVGRGRRQPARRPLGDLLRPRAGGHGRPGRRPALDAAGHGPAGAGQGLLPSSRRSTSAATGSTATCCTSDGSGSDAGACVGTRSILAPGTRVGQRAEVAAGSAVLAPVPPGESWAGSPAVFVGARPAPVARPEGAARLGVGGHLRGDRRPARLLSRSSPPGAACWSLWAGVGRHGRPSSQAAAGAARWLPLGAVTAFAVLAALTLVSVSGCSAPGSRRAYHPVRSRTGWQVWATERLMDDARTLLFPLYASLVTPVWLRALGATVGRGRRGVDRADAAADDDHGRRGVPRRRHDGRLLRAGRRVDADRAGQGRQAGLPRQLRHDGARARGAQAGARRGALGDARTGQGGKLVARLPAGAAAPCRLGADEAAHVRAAAAAAGGPRRGRGRCGWCRCIVHLRARRRRAAGTRRRACDRWGVLGAVAARRAGGAARRAASRASCRRRPSGCSWAGSERSEHPLWSSFVWRNELADTFVEIVAVPWFARGRGGTAALTLWLRALGAHMGRGCVVRDVLAARGRPGHRWATAATVNRGCVLQTHLFHDRIMSMDTVTLARGRDPRPARGDPARPRPSGSAPRSGRRRWCCAGTTYRPAPAGPATRSPPGPRPARSRYDGLAEARPFAAGDADVDPYLPGPRQRGLHRQPLRARPGLQGRQQPAGGPGPAARDRHRGTRPVQPRPRRRCGWPR